jgi:hypothetical protein
MSGSSSSFDNDVDFKVARHRPSRMPGGQRLAYALLILMLVFCVVVVMIQQREIRDKDQTISNLLDENKKLTDERDKVSNENQELMQRTKPIRPTRK